MMQLSLTEGQRLKREGLAQVEERNRGFLSLIRQVAKQYSRTFGFVTTDDLRAFAAKNDMVPTHHNAWGSVFSGKGWTVVGRQPSKLAGNHGREIKVWRWEGV